MQSATQGFDSEAQQKSWSTRLPRYDVTLEVMICWSVAGFKKPEKNKYKAT